MRPGIKAVVLLIIVNLAIASFCVQVCSTPVPTASHCPQHPQSGNTNCCDHSSKDATLALKADSAPGLKSMTLHFMLQPQMNSSSPVNPMTSAFRRFQLPDVGLRQHKTELSTILRV
jgi:hypothetical protein